MVETFKLPEEGEPKILWVIRGLPASGKSSWAKKIQAAAAPGQVVRINNDEISAMLYGHSFVGRDAKTLKAVREAMIASALACPTVLAVLIDNTNVNWDAVVEAKNAARSAGARFVLDTSFLKVPKEECIRRDALREAPVGAEVIEAMAERFAWRRPSKPAAAKAAAAGRVVTA